MADQIAPREIRQIEHAPEQGQVTEQEQYISAEIAPGQVPEQAKEAGSSKQDGAAELEHMEALRQGPLASAPVPAEPVGPKDLEEIKRLLFPNIDFTKETPTPEQLVMALLLEHNMDTRRAHDWVEFLAKSHQPE